MKPPSLESGFTTRFAPAPTGYLHLGHAVNAAWTWGIARAFGGRVLLRVEDHDRGRSKPEYEAALREDLDWLGLEPDGFSRQSDRGERYAARLSTLEAAGLAYACTCTRADFEGRYPGTCRDRHVDPHATPARRVAIEATAIDRVVIEPTTAEGVRSGGSLEHFSDLRLGAQSQDPAARFGDVLVRDRLGNWTYQFAVVVDDLEQDVDLIIRGEDLLESTGLQLRLARLLGRAAPPRFLHHPLVRHPDGRKLSKSSNDTGLRELRAAGRTPDEVLGLAAHLGELQAAPTPVNLDGLAALARRWTDPSAARRPS